MIGAYDAHFYCDSCRKFEEASHVDTASQARAQMRRRGWKFADDGHVFCPTCDPKTAPLLPLSKQEGGLWQNYC